MSNYEAMLKLKRKNNSSTSLTDLEEQVTERSRGTLTDPSENPSVAISKTTEKKVDVEKLKADVKEATEKKVAERSRSKTAAASKKGVAVKKTTNANTSKTKK